jgi:hypothetical protein
MLTRSCFKNHVSPKSLIPIVRDIHGVSFLLSVSGVLLRAELRIPITVKQHMQRCRPAKY